MPRAKRVQHTYCRRCRARVGDHTARIMVFVPDIGWRTVIGLCEGCYFIVMRQIENRRLVRS